VVCRHCGIEISDKALICYRCGTAVDDPSLPAGAGPGRGRRVRGMALVGVVALVLAGVFMGQAVTDQVPRWATWTLTVLATALLIWRVSRRGAK
jgi:hypothetical protein